MPSIPRLLLAAAAHGLIFANFLRKESSFGAVLAFPMPLPLAMPGDVAISDPRSKNRVHRPASSVQVKSRRPLNRMSEPARGHRKRGCPRAHAERIDALQEHYATAQASANELQTYAAQSETGGEPSPEFQTQAADSLTTYQESSSGVLVILDQLGADKGLANYDCTDQLESILKNVVNLNKDVLNSVDKIVENLPVLGPILGPIVYQIKCILDKILDTIENLTDSLLNSLHPLLSPIIDGYVSTLCSAVLNALNLCAP